MNYGNKIPVHHHNMQDLLSKHGHMHGKQHSNLQLYYWIVAEDAGRRVVFGPRGTIEDAERLRANIHGYSEIVALPTRNQDAARDMIRGKVLNNTGNIGESFNRINWRNE